MTWSPVGRARNWVCGFVFRRAGVVAWFMHWVRQRGFVPFAIYRIVLGIGLLTLLMRGVM